MFRKSFVFFLVPLEVFLRASFHATVYGEIIRIEALGYEKICSMSDYLRIDGIEGGMTEGEEVDGIEDVGLAYAVGSDHTVDLRRQVERGLPDVLIVDERQFL